MKRIAILHYKVGDTDGVSLEIEKWKLALTSLGHEVTLCAGDLGQSDGVLIAEMYHHTPEAERLYANTFIALQGDEAAYRAEMEMVAGVIEERLLQFIADYDIDFLIPHNLWSVAMNPAAALALARVVNTSGLSVFAQHHDFYWERIDGLALTCSTAVELADRCLPPRSPQIHHAVINSLAQQSLRERKGIESTIIPNVFDFDGQDWQIDEYNRDFREEIGLRENDVLILQATRLVRRKGIELAIDFVKALNAPERRAVLEEKGFFDGRDLTADSRIVLVLAGYAHDDPGGTYVTALNEKLDEFGVEAIFIEDRIGGQRMTVGGQKVYTLWDSYVHADFITYPSLWEGWGNQLLEAIKARLPYLIFEYPVYRADIKDKGLQAVSLGRKVRGTTAAGLAHIKPKKIDTAADQAVQLLVDEDLRLEMVNHNFEIARDYYSMAALRRQLIEIIDNI